MSGEVDKQKHDDEENHDHGNSGNQAVMRFIEITSIVGIVAGCAVIGWIAYDTYKRNQQAARRQHDLFNSQQPTTPTAPPNSAPRAAEPTAPPEPPGEIYPNDLDDSQAPSGDGESPGPEF